jgi:hypothetical protein
MCHPGGEADGVQWFAVVAPRHELVQDDVRRLFDADIPARWVRFDPGLVPLAADAPLAEADGATADIREGSLADAVAIDTRVAPRNFGARVSVERLGAESSVVPVDAGDAGCEGRPLKPEHVLDAVGPAAVDEVQLLHRERPLVGVEPVRPVGEPAVDADHRPDWRTEMRKSRSRDSSRRLCPSESVSDEEAKASRGVVRAGRRGPAYAGRQQTPHRSCPET